LQRELKIQYDKSREILSYEVFNSKNGRIVRKESIPAKPRQALRFISGLLSSGVMNVDEKISFYERVISLSRGEKIDEGARGDVEYFFLGALTRISESGGVFSNCDMSMALTLRNKLEALTTPAR